MTVESSPPLRKALRGRAPGLRLERDLWASGAAVVAGVDEVGRGSWAGPLTVAAVVADPDRRIYKVRDSKMLNPIEREALHDRIRVWARAVSVGHASVDDCNDLGMADAQRLAARRAVDGLGLPVDHVLIDGAWDFLTPAQPEPEPEPEAGDEPEFGDAPVAAAGRDAVKVGGSVPDVTTIVRGDAASLSIAAASVVAKVTRDRLMVAAADCYPAYGFASNKGYRCPRHVAALAAWGPCAIHRRRWVFMDDLRWSGIPRLTDCDDSQTSLFDSAV
ncbi:MAG: ribonuclease HII [Acidimicrobiaceae bacterium]|nr:ribonuclease HII [Acidimicrobiaceae bacterium]MCY4279520.1 ribonuclease HII [Acidimicrobiaceae bacterium]MCY4294045.1 ribonuclease HII [Acidimicrobiaceae bacterium]